MPEHRPRAADQLPPWPPSVLRQATLTAATIVTTATIGATVVEATAGHVIHDTIIKAALIIATSLWIIFVLVLCRDHTSARVEQARTDIVAAIDNLADQALTQLLTRMDALAAGITDYGDSRATEATLATMRDMHTSTNNHRPVQPIR